MVKGRKVAASGKKSKGKIIKKKRSAKKKKKSGVVDVTAAADCIDETIDTVKKKKTKIGKGKRTKKANASKKKKAESGVKRKRIDDILSEVPDQATFVVIPAETKPEERAPIVPSKGPPLCCADVTGGRALDSWLRQEGAVFDALEIRNDMSTSGLGAFARRKIAVGEVAFVMPAHLMLTAAVARRDDVVSRVAQLLQKWGEKSMPEFSMCLRLCRARSDAKDPWHAYASTLPQSAPGAAAWPKVFRDVLATTPLGPSLIAADAELDRWEALLKRVTSEDANALQPKGAYSRESIEWARGMLQSRQFPASFAGETEDAAAGSLCMVPLLDLLNHKAGADVTVRVKDRQLEFVCSEPVKAGEQIWNNYGAKSNDELLMCYGFAISDNPCDSVPMSLSSKTEIRLNAGGVPQDVIDAIEEDQNTEGFVSLLKAVLQRRRTIKDCLDKLPQALNFNVCKGPANRGRKRSIEAYLEGQHKVLEAALESMQTAQDDEEDGEAKEGDEDDELGDLESEEEENLWAQSRRKKKRRKR